MIEINSNIIDAEALYERVENSVRMKSIPIELYGEDYEEMLYGGGNKQRIRKSMLLVYKNLQMMHATYIIGEKPLKSNRPFIGKFIVLAKKIFRKLTRWLFKMYYDQQTEFNALTAKTLSGMIKVQEMLIKEIEEMERKEANHED